ncbi:MAG: hypothetical protein NTW94_07740 [Legionellales bacterium]|nr:hypothetical protein [Legionellales bacterium]
MPTDWIVWPIFLAQFFTFALIFLPKSSCILGIWPPTLISVLLMLICVAILLSLWHDSTDVLPLYF